MKDITTALKKFCFTSFVLMLPLWLFSQNTIDKVDKNFTGISAVDVEDSFCNISVSGEKRSDVHLTGEIQSSKNYDIKIRYEKSGSKLKVWLDRPRSIRGNIKGHITLKVPINTNINIINSSGNILVENTGRSEIEIVSASGNVTAKNIDNGIEITTASGDIKVEDATGDVHTTSASGSLYASGIKGNMYCVSSSGTQHIEGVKGNLKLTASSGSMDLSMINGNVNARSSSGSLKTDHVTGKITAVSSSGSIRLTNTAGSLNLITTSGSQKGTGIKLTGASSFKSSSGSVSMQLMNNADELSFELHSSSGSLSAKGQTASHKLVITKGPVMIFGKTSSGSQSYK
jgi:hypothetical protein